MSHNLSSHSESKVAENHRHTNQMHHVGSCIPVTILRTKNVNFEISCRLQHCCSCLVISIFGITCAVLVVLGNVLPCFSKETWTTNIRCNILTEAMLDTSKYVGIYLSLDIFSQLLRVIEDVPRYPGHASGVCFHDVFMIVSSVGPLRGMFHSQINHLRSAR